MYHHTHTERVDGCFRCDLATNERIREAASALAAGTATTVEEVLDSAAQLEDAYRQVERLGKLPPMAGLG